MRDDKTIQKMIFIIDKIKNYCSDTTYEDFLKDEILTEACVFNLTQLGEHAHKISDEIVTLHPEIAWREVYGLRNRLVHDYQGTNPKLVWEIISQDLDVLKSQLEDINC